MTLDVHRRRDRTRARRTLVWLNGVDVTNRCFYADGRRGVVRLYKHKAGRPDVEPPFDPAHTPWNPVVAKEELRGHVRWAVRA